MNISTAELDLLHNFILVVYIAIFLFFHANRIRAFAVIMADTLAPQTTPKKLFKPSSKTKTPTPVKRLRAPTPNEAAEPARSTLSQSTEHTSENLKGTTPSFKDKVSRARELSKQPSEGSSESMVGKLQEAPEDSASSLPDEASNPTDTLNSPTDIAKYFAAKGSPEMSSFVTALIGTTSGGSHETTPKAVESLEGGAHKLASPAEHIHSDREGATPNPMEELPTDDNLVVESNDRTKKAVDEVASNTTNKVFEKKEAPETTGPTQNRSSSSSEPRDSTSSDRLEPADISKKAEGALEETIDRASAMASANKTGEPDVSNISQTLQPAIPSSKARTADKAQSAANGSVSDPTATSGPSDLPEETSTTDKQRGGITPPVNDTDTQVSDNMGRPAHVERRIEIPLRRPERVFGHDLGNVNDLRSTEDLPSTDDLPDIPDDESQDPPEEILDPSVHSTSTSITPIPRIPKITPIDSAPPVDLQRLVQGLAGYVVDDVGNIIDESGKVLGHATGDLPAMVGKRVSDDGDIHGDSGEIIGYVSENFINPPPPTEIPGDVLGGLKVDHEGNILDSNGNTIGKFHQKPGANGSLPPFMQPNTSKAEAKPEEKPREEQKPRVNAHTGGSPSDIFLDVKSTTDGIQLTIRIPTTFSRPPQDS
ncbi:hypothetical protein F5Y19DRAFT_466729 [Xylariaceae sp. FL1651]|nr:hypothetical protein F5Y19DRAFT_466729 [Xylariaceae sp. FL1651]